jgi:hypothetical protein
MERILLPSKSNIEGGSFTTLKLLCENKHFINFDAKVFLRKKYQDAQKLGPKRSWSKGKITWQD